MNKERRRVARMCRGIGPTRLVEHSATVEVPSSVPKTAQERARVRSKVTEWDEREAAGCRKGGEHGRPKCNAGKA